MGLGSGTWKKPIPDTGSMGQKGNGSRIRIRNTGSNIAQPLLHGTLLVLVLTYTSVWTAWIENKKV